MVKLNKYFISIALAITLCGSHNVFSAQENELAVIELFTSQGCSSCPPADKLLKELIQQDRDIIGLEFHVDYWDDLRHGFAGKWKDPFSSPRYTDRQRRYDRNRLSGQRGVYTPQAVINGGVAVVGSNRAAIQSALSSVDQTPRVIASLQDHTDRGFTLFLTGDAKQSATVWLITFDRERVTVVPNGENAGKTLTNHNVVRKMSQIGRWNGAPISIPVNEAIVTENQSCAILVQSEGQGSILGAILC